MHVYTCTHAYTLYHSNDHKSCFRGRNCKPVCQVSQNKVWPLGWLKSAKRVWPGPRLFSWEFEGPFETARKNSNTETKEKASPIPPGRSAASMWVSGGCWTNTIGVFSFFFFFFLVNSRKTLRLLGPGFQVLIETAPKKESDEGKKRIIASPVKAGWFAIPRRAMQTELTRWVFFPLFRRAWSGFIRSGPFSSFRNHIFRTQITKELSLKFILKKGYRRYVVFSIVLAITVFFYS